MRNERGLLSSENAIEGLRVGNVSFVEACTRVDAAYTAVLKVINNRNFIVCIDKCVYHV